MRSRRDFLLSLLVPTMASTVTPTYRPAGIDNAFAGEIARHAGQPFDQAQCRDRLCEAAHRAYWLGRTDLKWRHDFVERARIDGRMRPYAEQTGDQT